MQLVRSLRIGIRRLSTPSASLQAGTRVTFPSERIPFLEEFIEPPVLRTDEMRAEEAAELKGYVPPLLMSQVEASLTSEFKQPILSTDWSRFEDPTSSHEQAARLLHYTLAIYGNVGRSGNQSSQDIAKQAELNDSWVREECEKLLAEIKTGDYSRWEKVEELAGEAYSQLTTKQQQAVRPAIALLGNNAWLHPRVKKQVIEEICRIVSATLKE
jgi:hypothetical protein